MSKKNMFHQWFKRIGALFLREPGDKDELIDVLRKAEQAKVLDHDALIMIEGALHVSEQRVRDVMVPRVQMIVIRDDAEPEDIMSTVIESGHSRFPVVGDTNDEIIGILLAKDLLNYFSSQSEEFDIKDLMRSAMFIPESKRLNMLLREFRLSRNHMAIVIDEYSGVAGLVTIEDVIEEIVGEIEDEHDYDDNEDDIKPHDHQRFTVKALTALDDFNQYFETKLSSDEHDTIGGYVINAFGHMPKRGETIDIDGFNIKVLRSDKRRVHVLLFSRLNTEVPEEEINDESD